MTIEHKGFTIKQIPSARCAQGAQVFRIYDKDGHFCDWDFTLEAAKRNIDCVLSEQGGAK